MIIHVNWNMSNLYYSKLTQKYYKSQQFNNFKYIFKKTYKKSTDLQIPFISHKLKQKKLIFITGTKYLYMGISTSYHMTSVGWYVLDSVVHSSFMVVPLKFILLDNLTPLITYYFISQKVWPHLGPFIIYMFSIFNICCLSNSFFQPFILNFLKFNYLFITLSMHF